MYDELIKRLRTDAVLVVFPLCDDLIEAADAIEELRKRVDESIPKDDAEIIIAEVAKPQWIPVTERLPKADEYDVRGYAVPYLVMNGWMRVTARRTKDYWVLFGEGKVLEYVTNWMPLPEPPEEET